MLKLFAQQVYFHDTTNEKVAGMQARLQLGLEFAINEVADFLEVPVADPGFVEHMRTAMRNSGHHSRDECV